ncbi:MAG TPA: hypothetical protein VIU11_13830 [Nakamurella sp.]
MALNWLDPQPFGQRNSIAAMDVPHRIHPAEHPSVGVRRPQSVAESLEIVEAWLGLPNVVTDQPDDRHAHRIGDILEVAGGRGILVNDAHPPIRAGIAV